MTRTLFDLFETDDASAVADVIATEQSAQDVDRAPEDDAGAAVELSDAEAVTEAQDRPSETIPAVPEQGGFFDDDSSVPFKLHQRTLVDVYARDAIVDEAFSWFRAQGFPYRKLPKFVMWQQINALAKTDETSLRQTAAACLVMDAFHPHRFHATVLGKVSPVQCFHDDVKFMHALSLRLDRAGDIPHGFFGELTLSRGTQQCSNFRPGFACWLYRRFCEPGATVLDTSTGYGGRLVGFIASNLGGTYIGIDPNTLTHEGNTAMADALGVSDRVMLLNQPVEDVNPEIVSGLCDFAFTSPPYFSKEHYSDEPTQSWKRYGHSFDAWVKGFLRPMLALTFEALKPGCFAVINIEDVNIGTKRYPLVKRTIDCATEIGFAHAGTELFEMAKRLGANQDEDVATERVLVFKRP